MTVVSDEVRPLPAGPSRWLAWAAAAIAAAMSLFHMWTTAFGQGDTRNFRATHLIFAMVLVFLLYPTGRNAWARRLVWADVLVIAGTLVTIGYLFVFYDHVNSRFVFVDDLTWTEQILAIVLVTLVLEATRRVIGWAMPLTALAFLLHAFFIVQMEPMRVLDTLYMTTDGIFGQVIGVSASYVVIFVLFGAFMERSGTGKLFMDFALSLTGHTAGGPGKVSVVSSSLFGTISGSAVANVMVDGPITIPLMKKSGFRPPFAAAVEAVASTGGQMMPPIMGAAAFVMAEFLGVSYFQVVLWAIIPSLLYYLAVFFAVHFEAKRAGLLGVPRSELPRLGHVLVSRGHLFLPIVVLLGGMFAGYSAPLCALVAGLLCFPTAMLRSETRQEISLRSGFDALVDGARNSLAVALACATAGVIIGTIAQTGIGITFTQMVVALAKDTLILALAVTAVAGIVLGMGLPTTPAYVLMTALLVPAIAKLGVPTPAAHMFAFYFAILSAITPPVALAVYAAAGLAKANLWEAGWEAVKIGFAGFLVPFLFVYNPGILMIGDWPTVIQDSVVAVLAILSLAAGLHGYMLQPLAMWERVALVVAACCLIKPGLYSDGAGLALFIMILAVQWFTRNQRAHLSPTPVRNAE